MQCDFLYGLWGWDIYSNRRMVKRNFLLSAIDLLTPETKEFNNYKQEGFSHNFSTLLIEGSCKSE